MTDEQVALLSKGLTKAQREEVLSLTGEWTQRKWAGQRPPWDVWLPPSVLEQATPTQVHSQRLRLTETGLAVRAYLTENPDA